MKFCITAIEVCFFFNKRKLIRKNAATVVLNGKCVAKKEFDLKSTNLNWQRRIW